MLEFIVPSIEKRIENITKESNQNSQQQYIEFDQILANIKRHLPDHLHDAAEQLETMYIQRTDDIAPVYYRTGFDDAIKLFRFFQNVSSDQLKINQI
ncbi:hypothetical protein [Paenibacillus hunanensis]|uniref:Uncharacterized protein n=1 Tax=Paenibacillus hunanensis TaxID=539262 RepID=A0ABU1IWA7_9BACL|nr:hypothetical protein [Paenibacillus hunanensis]MDR6243523.1 hypothetical protein [Paenibacillus hunanensis]GGI98339.1 hypothetical protein GCM10008022_03870 [Paenibacillus hunanensis]